MRTEARLPCPVCLGVKLEKVRVEEQRDTLTLDACRRCGGVWFELGEVQRVRRHAADALLHRLPPARADVRTFCHACRAPLDRGAGACAACGVGNRLACPACSGSMQRQVHGTLVLDICTSCKGVWFDRAELEGIWQLEVSRALTRRQLTDQDAPDPGGIILLDALFWAPDVAFLGLAAGADVAGAAAGAIGNLPAAAAGAADVVGEAAGSLFETIAEIIGSIFG